MFGWKHRGGQSETAGSIGMVDFFCFEIAGQEDLNFRDKKGIMEHGDAISYQQGSMATI